MLRTFEYRIYPTDAQKELLSKHFGCVRWLYNYALSKKISHFTQTGETLSVYDLKKDLPSLKRDESTAWLKEVNSQSLQQSLFHLDTAYKRFFKKLGGFPKFKNRKSNQSFEIPQSLTVDFEASTIRIPKFKEPIRTVFHRKFAGDIGTCHVKRTTSGKYFVAILVDDGSELPPKPDIAKENAIGVDVGIKTFIVTSDGEEMANPRHYFKCQRRLARIQRSFSRKVKSKKKGDPLSKNAEKAKLKLQLLHERVANQRKDYIHKVSTKLIRENQTICIEDLNVKGMMKNRTLSKHIQDVGWGMFFQFLRYKSEWYGRNILTIGRFEPSSKTCSGCGYINRELKLSDRTWTCPVCGECHDRDINAAINIRNFPFTNTGSTRNTQESKSASYGNSSESSAERMPARAFEAHESLAQGQFTC